MKVVKVVMPGHGVADAIVIENAVAEVESKPGGADVLVLKKKTDPPGSDDGTEVGRFTQYQAFWTEDV